MPRSHTRRLEGALCMAFFCSGVAGLLFETLWFRSAGLVLGNSVWASSVVLAAFMFGLALGNGLAARYGQRVAAPVRVYALAEGVVAVVGFGIVVSLPALTARIGPAFGALGERLWLVNSVRLAVAFVVMALPATAMGLTLPLLARTLGSQDVLFARVLGNLYGWNTLGGVTGALLGESLLFARLGLRLTGVCAAMFALTAATIALAWGRQLRADPGLVTGPEELPVREDRPAAVRLSLAAALSGCALLALEVVWFRFLLLFVYGTGWAFALMLAAILVGIGLGGLLPAWRLDRGRPRLMAGYVALACAVTTTLAYAAFVLGPERLPWTIREPSPGSH